MTPTPELPEQKPASEITQEIDCDCERDLDHSHNRLWKIWERIELINKHFEACCAFQMDKCHWADEYDELYGRLRYAGIPDHETPCNRKYFEEWMRTRDEERQQ